MLIQPSPCGASVGVSEAAARPWGNVLFIQLLFHVTELLSASTGSESPSSSTVFIKVKEHRHKTQLSTQVLSISLAFISPRKPLGALMQCKPWDDKSSILLLYHNPKTIGLFAVYGCWCVSLVSTPLMGKLSRDEKQMWFFTSHKSISAGKSEVKVLLWRLNQWEDALK